jgi:mono/diheme cytochrome c family protein/glucose/arabinose dehydrogenase
MTPRFWRLVALSLFVGACGSPPTPAPDTGDAPMNVDIVHPDSIPAAPIRSPEEAIADFDVIDGFAVDLVVSEPDVVDPVALSFDEDGAMWVIEMRDYMVTPEGDKTGDPAGRVVVVRDMDGDGRYDSSQVFMEGLYLPRAISLYNKGVLLAVPPNLFFVERNGYKAGRITVVDSAYAVGGNPEHQPNGLLVAMDNWIYSAKSDQRYRFKEGRWVKEKTEYRGQWGITQDNWGRLFYNNNSQTLLGDDLRPGLAGLNPHHDVANRRFYGPSRASNNTFPRRVTPGVNRGYQPGILDSLGKLVNVTSAAGPVIYRGDQFPDEYQGYGFIQETAANLVKWVALSDENGKVTGSDPSPGREFLTSTDERFRPVNGYTAPDGSLYIVDMYRGVIQHSTYLTDYLKRQIDMRGLALPLGLGRIYRVKWATKDVGPAPRLGSASDEELVRHLTHPNGWWRDTAQRLLIERRANRMETALASLATGAPDPLTRLHALWTLEGLGKLSPSVLELAARSTHPKVKGAVAQLAGELKGERMLRLLEKLAGDASTEVALHVASALPEFYASNQNRAMQAQWSLAATHPDSKELIDVILGSLEDREQIFLDVPGPKGSETLARASRQAAGMALVKSLDDIRLLPASFEPAFDRGKDVYTSFCATCHGSEGMGLTAVAPPLVRSQWVLQSDARLIHLVLNGVQGPMEVDGVTYDAPEIAPEMPGLRDMPFTDQEIADVLTYVRNAWGNQAGGVVADQVTAIRKNVPPGVATAQTLKDAETGWTPLFDGVSLAGWKQVNGKASYKVVSGAIEGQTVMDSPNSFLATEKEYADFTLEIEFLVDPVMNSGIQIRSHSIPSVNNGRVHGYQVEIDPSERAWTAGIYEEGLRGWLFNLDGRTAAQKAFRQNEWNHVRIEAHGSHLRTWLNGVLAADMIDTQTAKGFIALQVHSIGDPALKGKKVSWRNIRIKESASK